MKPSPVSRGCSCSCCPPHADTVLRKHVRTARASQDGSAGLVLVGAGDWSLQGRLSDWLTRGKTLLGAPFELNVFPRVTGKTQVVGTWLLEMSAPVVTKPLSVNSNLPDGVMRRL